MTLLEAYARLTSLREHLPGTIPPRLAEEFHRIVNLLEVEAGVSLQAFHISADAIHPTETLQHYSEWDGSPYSSTIDAYCEHSEFMMRLDGVIRLFQMLDSSRASGKSPIGFRPP